MTAWHSWTSKRSSRTTETKGQKSQSNILDVEQYSCRCFCVVLIAKDNGFTTPFHGEGTSSYRFNRFTQGIGNRMASDIRKNVFVSTELYIKIPETFSEDKIRISEDEKEMGQWLIGGAFFCFSYVCSLRGEEGFLSDIKRLKENRSLSNGFVW